jgi:hypothetical protein
MQSILQTTARVQESRLRDGLDPVRRYKQSPPTHPRRRALTRLNILLRSVTRTSEGRLALASRIFGRPITSTYDLTVGELYAFLTMAYPESPLSVDREFLLYLEAVKEAVCESSEVLGRGD